MIGATGRRVLVTGGAGFIGSHLVERLVRTGHNLAVIDNLSTGFAHNLEPSINAGLPEEHIFYADLLTGAKDIMAWFRPDVVIHLAAQSYVHTSMEDPQHDLEVNVVGAVRLFEAARCLGTRRIIVASSGGTIYGERHGMATLTAESARCQPISFYGLSKHAADELASLYQRHFGIEHVSLALGNVYGRRQNPHGESRVLSIFAHRIAAGLECEITGDGSALRDYVHIDDVVDAFIRALTRGTGLINIGTGVGTSVASAYAMLASLTGIDRPPVHVQKRAGEVQAIVLDPSRAAQLLGWRPRIQLLEGLEELIADARSACATSSQAQPAPLT